MLTKSDSFENRLIDYLIFLNYKFVLGFLSLSYYTFSVHRIIKIHRTFIE